MLIRELIGTRWKDGAMRKIKLVRYRPIPLLGYRYFRCALAGPKDSKSKTKIIIFLSDGVNSSGAISPETAIELARVFNIKIYSIGIGSNNKINVTRRTPSRERNFEFDEQLLVRMAEKTGGQYSHAGNGEDLKEAFENISRLEKSHIQTSITTRVEEQFLPFLIIGFFFVFLEISLRYSVFRKFP